MDDTEDDDFCRYGTPLDPYEDDDVPKKKSAYQDITEQYALDSQGKRRFHGAFTGGFTAGHGNSVAVPEGWTPQTFKSSRSDRMKLTQKAEDFMDDEDRNEFGIAPRQVHTTKEFSGSKRKKQQYFQDGPIPGEPVLHRLLEPVHETVAIKILKSMGWRPGRGIGEKITHSEKKTAHKLYTCHVPIELRNADESKVDNAELQNIEESSEDEEIISEILFEPDDFEPYLAKPKIDSFGIGYVGLSRHSILGAYVNPLEFDDKHTKKSHLLTNDKGKKVSIRGQAFGVGALENEDEDIYARDDMSAYDFSLDVSNKAKKKPDKKSKNAPSSSKSILDGFVAATSLQPPMKVFPPPALPHNYVPGKTRKSRFSSIEDTQSEQTPMRDQGLGRHDLTAKQRGSILGEQTSDNPPTTKKAEKPIPKTTEEKLAAIVGRNINFVNNSDEAKESNATSPVKLPESDGSFRPFATNPTKQLRYEKFIAMKQGLSSSYMEDEKESGDKLLNWERDRELAEFEQAYKLYKPLTGAMKDRFVSAVHQEDISSPLIVAKDKDYYIHASNERQEAARLGKFGLMTRDTAAWRPESLLCKRFNVPEPQNGGYATQSEDKKKVSYSLFEYLEAPVHDKRSYLRDQRQLKSVNSTNSTKPVEANVSEVKKSIPTLNIGNDSTKKKKRLTVAELFMQEKEKERESLDVNSKETDQLAFQKELTKPNTTETDVVKETIDSFNKIDLYKAVFLSDSESETEEESPENSKDKEKLTLADLVARNVERNPSPPRGIFANLNLDRINSWRKPELDKDIQPIPEVTKMASLSSDKSSIGTATMDVDVYGPKLPEKHLFTSKKTDNESKSEAVEISSSSDSSDDWVESSHDASKKSKRSKSKSSKKKKKKDKSIKHHKHKTKKKHKKK